MTMPLCRIRQIVEIISQRRSLEISIQAAMVEWHAKHVASASAMSAEAGKSISAWTLLPEEEEESVEPLTSEEEIAQVVEQGSQTAAEDPRNDLAISWLEHTLGGGS